MDFYVCNNITENGTCQLFNDDTRGIQIAMRILYGDRTIIRNDAIDLTWHIPSGPYIMKKFTIKRRI